MTSESRNVYSVLGDYRSTFFTRRFYAATRNSCRDWFGLLVGKAIGMMTDDVVITKAEIEGLKAYLLYVDAPPAGPTRLTDWLREHRETVGKKYAGELARRKN